LQVALERQPVPLTDEEAAVAAQAAAATPAESAGTVKH
jgi:ATP-dependent Lon protease